MQSIICLLLPTFIALNIIKKRDKINYKDLLFKYPLYNIIINGICFFIVIIYLKSDTIIFSEIFNNLIFCVKYLIMASFIAIIIPYIANFLSKNINIRLELKRSKNEK